MTGKPEVIGSPVGFSTANALALTKPPHFAHLEFDFVDCWERFGKELKVSKHRVNCTESTGHMFLVRLITRRSSVQICPPQPFLIGSQELVGFRQHALFFLGKIWEELIPKTPTKLPRID
jgi:hypothetical protein